MKEAIRMVPESIYDSGRGCHSALRRIKEEWSRCGFSSRWFLEFDIKKCSIDRHRFISILKEEIDDPHPMFSAVGGEKGPDSVPQSVLLSALPGNIYLNKLDQEIGRIRQKHEIDRLRSVLFKKGRRQEHSREEASFNAPLRAALMVRKSIQRKATFHSSSWHTPPTSTPRRRWDQTTPFVFPPSLAAFLYKPSSLLGAAFLIEAAGLTQGREGFPQNGIFMNKLRELDGGAILVLRSERHQVPSHLIKICYARYADDLLLGIVGALELLLEIQKRITHFLQSGLNRSAGSTTIAARSTVEFPGTIIREVPPRTTPIQFLRELEKRLRVKHRIHITACRLRSAIYSKDRQLTRRGCLLDAVKLADTLGTAGVRSPQVSVLWGTAKHIRQGSRQAIAKLLHSSGRSNVPQVVSRSIRKCSLENTEGSEFPIQIEAPIKKILRRLRDRGLISGIRPRPIHVASLTNVSDGDIVNWSAGIAISPLSYYRCRDNLYQVRTIVDHQIRWSAIFTLAHKHKSSARNIIPKYPKDSNIVI